LHSPASDPSKSASIFGNGVVPDADAKGLTKDERNDIVGDWVEDWRGSPKNGHTTHLLMSFLSHVRPEKTKLIADAWAFEMFQSGKHQDDVWSYVAALHTDKAHPHVHMVVNSRGTVNAILYLRFLRSRSARSVPHCRSRPQGASARSVLAASSNSQLSCTDGTIIAPAASPGTFPSASVDANG